MTDPSDTTARAQEDDVMAWEVPHPSRYIREELIARRWTWNRLAHEMGGIFGINRLSLDMYFRVGPTATNMRLGDESATAIAAALGVSTEFLLNLERSWLISRGVPPPQEQKR